MSIDVEIQDSTSSRCIKYCHFFRYDTYADMDETAGGFCLRCELLLLCLQICRENLTNTKGLSLVCQIGRKKLELFL